MSTGVGMRAFWMLGRGKALAPRISRNRGRPYTQRYGQSGRDKAREVSLTTIHGQENTK